MNDFFLRIFKLRISALILGKNRKNPLIIDEVIATNVNSVVLRLKTVILVFRLIFREVWAIFDLLRAPTVRKLYIKVEEQGLGFQTHLI